MSGFQKLFTFRISIRMIEPMTPMARVIPCTLSISQWTRERVLTKINIQYHINSRFSLKENRLGDPMFTNG